MLTKHLWRVCISNERKWQKYIEIRRVHVRSCNKISHDNMSYLLTRRCLSLVGPDNWYIYHFIVILLNIMQEHVYYISRFNKHGAPRVWWRWLDVMPNGLVFVKCINHKFNSAHYFELLKAYDIPLMNLNYKSYCFVQVNASIHARETVVQYLSGESSTLVWPSKSSSRIYVIEEYSFPSIRGQKLRADKSTILTINP